MFVPTDIKVLKCTTTDIMRTNSIVVLYKYVDKIETRKYELAQILV